MEGLMGLARFMMEAAKSGGISTGHAVFWKNHVRPIVGQTYKVGLYWVEVVGYSPKTRNVRYRRITAKGKPLATVESMGQMRFRREATLA